MCGRGLLLQHPTFAEVQFSRTAAKRKVEDGAAGETADKLNHSIRRRNRLYEPLFWLRPSGFGKQEVDSMLRKLAVAISALGMAAGAFALDTPAQAQAVKAGVLTCNVASGFGFIFGSSRAVNCTFSPGGGPPQ